MAARAKTGRGFTLIEVLVAFLILAFSLAALFDLFSGSLRSVRLGGEYAQATALARAQLARIDADGIEGPGIEGSGIETGRTADGYRWRVEFAPMPALPERARESGYGPLSVSVTVSWGPLDGRSVALTTVRMARR